MRRRPESGANPRVRVMRKLPQVFLDLLLLVAPCEVVVGLVEPNRAQGLQHRRFGECLGEEDDIRVKFAELRQQALPERDGLCVWVVHTEDSHAVSYPQLKDALDLLIDSLRIVVEV